MDATFRVVRKPFEQLFGIHAFVKGDKGNIKQVPLAFVIMSGKRKKDYRKVLKAILRLLEGCNVGKFVMDFEMVLWSAVRSTFPMAKIQGCAFHWKQAVWRKVQSLGLAVPYINHRPTLSSQRNIYQEPLVTWSPVRLLDPVLI